MNEWVLPILITLGVLIVGIVVYNLLIKPGRTTTYSSTLQCTYMQTECTTGPNESECQNGGIPTGSNETGCECDCASGFSGANCETQSNYVKQMSDSEDVSYYLETDLPPHDKTVQLKCGTASYVKKKNDTCNRSDGSCICQSNGIICEDTENSIGQPIYFTDDTNGVLQVGEDVATFTCETEVSDQGDPKWGKQHNPDGNLYGRCWDDSLPNVVKNGLDKCNQFIELNNLSKSCDMNKQI